MNSDISEQHFTVEEAREYQQVSRLLRMGFRKLSFDPPLESEFRHYYQQDTLTILRANTVQFITAYVAAVLILFLQMPYEAMGNYPAIIALFSVLVVALSIAGNSGFFERWVFLGIGGATLAGTSLVMSGVPSVTTEAMHDMAVAGTALLFCIVYAISRLRLLQCLFWCSLSGPMVWLWFRMSGQDIDPNFFNSCWVAPNVVGVSIGYFVEHRERTVFLQDKQIQLEKKKLAELTLQLDALSKTDPLTRLSNRRHFDENLALEWHRALRSGRPLGLLMLDVDHFKLYNDHYGHPAGDEVLVRIADVLRSCTGRPTDMVARLGGEEFAVLLPDTDAAGCEVVAEKAHRAVAALAIPHALATTMPQISMSIGVASVIPTVDGFGDHLVDLADKALYEAKREGRNRTSISLVQTAPT